MELYAHECTKSRLDITQLHKLDADHILIIHKYKKISTYTLNTCSHVTTYNTDLLGEKTTADALHPTKKLLALANKNVIYIIDLETKRSIQTIPTFNEDVQRLHFMDNHYLVAGSTGGRIMLYTINATSQLSRLCSFPIVEKRELLRKNNYISAFASHNDLLACSGFGGDIIIVNPAALSEKFIIKNQLFRVNAIVFIDHQNIIYGTAKGEVIFYNLLRHDKTTLSTPYSEIADIKLIKNTKYALVSAPQENTLVLLDIEQKKIRKHPYIHTKTSIRNFLIYETKLVVQLSQNDLVTFNLYDEQELRQFVISDQLAPAFEQIEANPLLEKSQYYKKLLIKYNALFHRALQGLLHNNKSDLTIMMKTFRDSKEHLKELRDLEKEFQYYPKFKTLCRENKYALALSMADRYKKLQLTPLYRKLEEQFLEDFSFAQKQIKLGNLKLTKQLLAPYQLVPSKKELCSLVLRDNSLYTMFIDAIETKDYKTIFSIVQEHEVLKEIPPYKKLLEDIEQQRQELYKLFYEMQTYELKQQLPTLANIPHIADEIKELYSSVLVLEKLLLLYDTNQLKECYELLDSNKLLKETQIAQQLEERWAKTIAQCEIFALKGNIKGVKQTLGSLLFVSTRTEAIGNLLRLSFQTKIKQLLIKRLPSKAELLIYSYIDIFGIDTQMRHIIKQYEKIAQKQLAITVNLQPLPRDHWVYSEIMKPPSSR